VGNYDEFKNSSLLFKRIVKQSKKSLVFDMPRNKLHSHTQFFANFYDICIKNIKGPYFMNSSSSGEYLIFCMFYFMPMSTKNNNLKSKK
jgi:hypothetical protein